MTDSVEYRCRDDRRIAASRARCFETLMDLSTHSRRRVIRDHHDMAKPYAAEAGQYGGHSPPEGASSDGARQGK
jgi:hypothetical protein